MKKVIFVGGTAYSGSTFFHMILANDPGGFATGEVQWVFNPRRDNHVNMACTCSNEEHECETWQQVRANGEENLYDTIFERFPHVNFIVTSSKSPFWIHKQNKLLEKKGIDYKNIVIWKTPLEFAQSANRRGMFDVWEKNWVNYYRLFASVMPEWRAVKYADIVHNKEQTLKTACSYLDIPYFAGKEDYWESQHHVLSGNTSARFHLYDNKDAQEIVKDYDKERLDFYRKIYYRKATDDETITAVNTAKNSEPQFEHIENMLQRCDVSQAQLDKKAIQSVAYPLPSVEMRRVKDNVLTTYGKVKYKSELETLSQVRVPV